jgi:hypothetical protein
MRLELQSHNANHPFIRCHYCQRCRARSSTPGELLKPCIDAIFTANREAYQIHNPWQPPLHEIYVRQHSFS